MIHVLSLGAGVQSSTVALMAAAGELTPMPAAGIFADTKREPASVYRWLDWLETKLPFPVIRATAGDLGEDNLQVRTSQKSGRRYSRSLIPTFIKHPDGHKGILPRKCTRDYKINVIQRELRKLLGVRAVRSNSPVLITQWIGISSDEVERVKESQLKWIINRYPLIELGASRQDCLLWMQAHGYPQPPRSACVFCPYHSDAEWLRLQTQEPEEFQKAVEWERLYTISAAQDEVMTGVPFLHDSLVPLDQVKFNPKRGKLDQFLNECEGMCGV